MDFDEWMRLGIERGWAGPPVCSTHDGIPTTEDEEVEFEDSNDPCIHVIRPYADAEMKAAVEANHAPSVWRDHYTKKPLPPGSTVLDMSTGEIHEIPGQWGPE